MDSNDIAARIAGELGSTAGQEQAPVLHPPPKVADHALLRRIGAGSYGEVWLAQSLTGQWRAVKAVSRDRFSSDRPYEREFRGVVQFEPISRSHSSLVHVLHVGRDDEARAFYYVMELADPAVPTSAEDPTNATNATIAECEDGAPRMAIDPLPGLEPRPAGVGEAPADRPSRWAEAYAPRTLRSDLKSRGRLPVRDAVELGVELAGALGHIHRHGLVHRDVKPSNVIYVQGRPKLADLGLVTHRSEARSFVGTEGFIPPEGPGTTKADLFGLGRLLYEAVTGKDRCEFPELPADLDAWRDREEFLEFNEVVTRLCAPEPDRRYANAAEVAGDLNLILAGRSVRRANGIERRLQQARRILVMSLLGLALLIAVIWVQDSQKHAAETRAAREQQLRHRAEEAEREGQRQLFNALLEQARATVRGGELGQRVKALDAVARAAALTNTAELRREALTALALPDLRLTSTVRLLREFTAKDPDPTFQRVATCDRSGPVEIRDLPGLNVVATLPASTNLPCYGVRWSATGRFAAVRRDHPGGSGFTLEVWDLEPAPRRLLVFRQPWYSSWAFHPHRPELTACPDPHTVARYSLETGQELDRTQVESIPIHLHYAPDGNTLAAAYRIASGWAVSVHRPGDATVLVSNRFDSFIGSLAWHPDGRWLAVTDFRGGVHLFDPANGDIHLLGRHRAEAVNATFDPRGEYLLTGGWERSIICWNLRARQQAFQVERDSWIPRFSPDGATVAISLDAEIELYRFERPSAAREVPLHAGSRVRHAAFSPDGRWLAVATDAGVNVCDLQTGECAADAGPSPRLFWNSEGTELFGSSSGTSNGSGGGTHHWRVHPGPLPGQSPTLERLPFPRPAGFDSFSVHSNRVVWTSAAGSAISLLKTADITHPGDPDHALAAPANWTKTARGINAQSRDGRWLAMFAPNSPYLHVYQLPEFQRVAIVTNHPRISGFTFSPSGRELAVVSRGHAEFYATGSWQHLRGTTNVVGIHYLGCLYSPDEQSVWFGHQLRSAGLHDSRTFELLLPLPTGQSPMAISADGRRLAVSEDARRVLVWDLPQVHDQLSSLGLEWAHPNRGAR